MLFPSRFQNALFQVLGCLWQWKATESVDGGLEGSHKGVTVLALLKMVPKASHQGPGKLLIQIVGGEIPYLIAVEVPLLFEEAEESKHA